jgi:hypothetical protein
MGWRRRSGSGFVASSEIDAAPAVLGHSCPAGVEMAWVVLVGPACAALAWYGEN